jgi:hypothetical protein
MAQVSHTLQTLGQVMPLEFPSQGVRSRPSGFTLPNGSLLLTTEPFTVIHPVGQDEV